MPEYSWKGQVGHESEDSFSEEEERTPLPQKRKRRKKKKELRYGTWLIPHNSCLIVQGKGEQKKYKAEEGKGGAAGEEEAQEEKGQGG